MAKEMTPYSTMQHLNGHPICAVDVETTGLQAGFHEIVQVAILALDHTMQADTDITPFDILIQPQHWNRIDQEARQKLGNTLPEAIETGIDPEAAIGILEHWITKHLQLPDKRRIVILGTNCQFDCGFLKEWLGYEHFNLYFDTRYRDVLAVANFLNDRANFSAEQIPFAGRMGLSRLAHRVGIEVDLSMLHDALYDASLAAQTYRAMLLGPSF
jgi:DNA polymerase III alpha subunit (gram-positive type)